MTYFVKFIAVVAAMGLMATPAWACNQQGQQTQGSQRLLTSDYISPALHPAPAVQPVRFFARRGCVDRPYYSHRYYYGGPDYYYGPYGNYGWGYQYHGGPWLGFYRPYYRGGLQVGPAGVWW